MFRAKHLSGAAQGTMFGDKHLHKTYIFQYAAISRSV